MGKMATPRRHDDVNLTPQLIESDQWALGFLEGPTVQEVEEPPRRSFDRIMRFHPAIIAGANH